MLSAHERDLYRRSEREDGPVDLLLRKYGVDPLDDSQLSGAVDEITAADLRDLRARKELAARAEDYEYASQLKRADGQLLLLGAEILRLDNERIAAVACEDYDEAKELRAAITWLQRDAARRKALAIAARGDPTPVTLVPTTAGDDEDTDLALAGGLAPADAVVAEPLVDAFGDRVTAAALSAHWRAQLCALRRIARRLEPAEPAQPTPPPPPLELDARLGGAVGVVVERALCVSPALPQAVIAATEVVVALCAAAERAGGRAGACVDALIASAALAALAARAADTHAPSREEAAAACVALVDHPMVKAPAALRCVLALCEWPAAGAAAGPAWRTVVISLQLLRAAAWRCRPLDCTGAQAEAAAEALPLGELASAIGRGLRHPHADVRASAAECGGSLFVLSQSRARTLADAAPQSAAKALAAAYALAAAAAQEAADRTDLDGLRTANASSAAATPRSAPQNDVPPADMPARAAAECEAARRRDAAIAIQRRGRGNAARADAALTAEG
jgi:hypothetical protein